MENKWNPATWSQDDEIEYMKIGDRVQTGKGKGVITDVFWDNYGDTVVVEIDGAEHAFDPDEVTT